MDIRLIEQREIEARMASELVAAYAEAIGHDQALKIAGQAVGRMACQAGRDLRAAAGTGTLQDLAGVVRDIWARDGALTIDLRETSPTKLRFNVTRCRYAELYERMDVKDLGYYLSCGRDAAFAQGFNANIRLTRTQTIMQGAAYCDFCFDLTAGNAAARQPNLCSGPPDWQSADNQRGEFDMARFFRMIVHIFVFAIGIGAVGLTNFWDWELLRGLLLPVVAGGFFFYLVLFVATGAYKVFLPSGPGKESV